MFNDRFAELMARKVSGMATEEELREFRNFLDQNPGAQYFYEVFSEYWHFQPSAQEDDIQEEIHFQQIIAIAEKNSIEIPLAFSQPDPGSEPATRVFSLKKILLAAAVTGLILTGYFVFKNMKTGPVATDLAWHEVVARPAVRTSLRLPDGTKVWLNSESRLEYKTNFNDSIREVTLEGEGYFDVVKDKTRPFIVHTSDIDIRVLGTVFNVKSYPQESSIEATLIHGMIEVTNKKEPSSPKVILKDHQKLVFNKEGQDKQSVPADKKPSVHKPFSITYLPRQLADSAIVETSWVYDKLMFDGESLAEIARKMERWYNVKIRFKSEKVARVPIHVEFKDESIEEALKALQLIEPFVYLKNGNQIEIMEK